MEGAEESITPLYQCLHLAVDLDGSCLRGRTLIWLRCTPTPYGSSHVYPSRISLHGRQMLVTQTKVNGCPASAKLFDSLADVVEGNYRNAEAFDIYYRATLTSNAQDSMGELNITIPSNHKTIPDLPPALPDSAPPAARARWKETVRLIKKSKLIEERKEVKRKRKLGSGSGGNDDVDYDEDDDFYGMDEEDIEEADGAPRRARKEEDFRIFCVEVEWTLDHPLSGVVFRRATVFDGFTAPHMYTTYSHAPIDFDGPRCWFPCLDHSSLIIAYDVTVIVPSPNIAVAFNGKLLEKDTVMDEEGNVVTVHRFATETLTAARAVGMTVGRFGVWDVPQSPRMKGMFLRAYVDRTSTEVKDRCDHKAFRGSRAEDRKTAAAIGQLLAHVPLAISFLEEWLKADYPFKRCTYVFVEGLSELFLPFGSLCLVKAELIARAADRIHEGDLPGDAKLSVVEVLLYGWVSTALRLEGGKQRWLLHGIVGYLLTQFAAEFRGEEEKQHRLWRAMQRAVALDCDLGCPSICPPTADNYIMETMDPATAYYTRLKASLILHMIEVKVQLTDLQDAIGQLMLPVALHAQVEDVNLERQSSMFSLSRQSSMGSQGSRMRQASLDLSMTSIEGADGVAGASMDMRRGSGEDGVEDIGDHFMQPLTAVDFMQLVRSVAAKGGHDLGKDLTESFFQQWVTGQCVPYLRVGYHHKKKANVINLVVEQVVPPWMGGIACHGPLTIEIWEADSLASGEGPRRFKQSLPPSRDEKKTPMHCEVISCPVQSKNRRRRRPASSNARSTTPVPDSNNNNNNSPKQEGEERGDTAAQASAAAVESGGGGAQGNRASPTASGGLGFGFELGLGEVDPERQAMFQAQDANSTPVLWVKVDPKLEWIMSVRMRKPWHQWVEQLFSDESVEAQCDALRGLAELPLPFHVKNTEVPVQAIAEAVRGKVAHTQMEHPPCVRMEAAIALALWQNQHAPPHAGGFGESKEARVQSWRGLYHLLQAFGERFEHRESPNSRPGMSLMLGLGSGGANRRKSALLVPNWFDDVAEYRLKKALIWAAANMRSRDGCTPLESLELLVALLRENDNTDNSYSDDYYIAQILTALGQISTAQESGLPASAITDAITQARLCLDLDLLRVSPGQAELPYSRKCKSHNGVVAACALQCLCQLELLRGGRPEVDYKAYTKPYFPLAVRIAAVQSMIHLYLAYDSGVDPSEDNAEGLSMALLWVLNFVEEKQCEEEVKYWTVKCLLDALERRPMVAAHLARFQTDDSLLGECDPWAGMEFHTPLGPGRASYRPNGPLPKEFPKAAEVAEKLWALMVRGTAFNQGLRNLCFQLWRNLWGLETPPCLVNTCKSKSELWSFDRDKGKKSKEADRSLQRAFHDTTEAVKGWVMSRYRRRDSVHRDWIGWYFRDKDRQAKVSNGKRKGEEEEEDITAIPWDGYYGPEPPKEDVTDVSKITGFVQWKDSTTTAAGTGGAVKGEEPLAKKAKIVGEASG